MLNPIEKLEAFRSKNGLSKGQLAQMMGIPVKTIEPWFCPGPSGYIPGKKNLRRIQDFLANKLPEAVRTAETTELEREAERRAEKIKYLLLLLEDELRWFKDTPQKEARQVLRRQIYFNDVGYISSLLGMLGDEEMFQRWKTLTNYRFKGLRGGGDGNSKN